MPSQGSESDALELCAAAKLSEGADVVIDATGVESCIECGIHSLKRGGTFVQAGLGSPRINFPIAQICDKEAVLEGSFRYGPGDYQLVVELLKSRRVGVRDMITHQFALGEAEKAFMNVAGRNGIKTIIYGPGVDSSLVG